MNEAMYNAVVSEAREILLSAAIPKRDIRILMFYYGIMQHTAHTLEETGREFCISRGRVWQIIRKTIKGLRDKHKLHDCLELIDELRADPNHDEPDIHPPVVQYSLTAFIEKHCAPYT